MPPSTGWETISLGTTEEVWEVRSTANYVDEGQFAAWVGYDMDEQSNEWLLSPVIDPGTLSDLSLTFRAFSSTENFRNATMKVWVTDENGDVLTDFSPDPLWDSLRDENWGLYFYRTVFVDLSDFAGYASPIRIAWQYIGINGNPFGLDLINISTTSEVSWLSADPNWGPIPAYQTVDVDLAFDTTGLTPGDYFGAVEPLPFIPIPITLHVVDDVTELYLPLIFR